MTLIVVQLYVLAGRAHVNIDLVYGFACLSLANIVLVVVKDSEPSVRHYILYSALVVWVVAVVT